MTSAPTSEKGKPKRSIADLVLLIVFSSIAGLFGIVMVLIAPSSEKPLGSYLFGAFCLLIAAACFVRGRAQRALGSLVASGVLAVTVWYLAVEILGGESFSGSPSVPSVFNAVVAFAVFGLPACMYIYRSRFGFGPDPYIETITIDDSGISRRAGSTNEHIRWEDVDEIRIITTGDGPYGEDVFFALVDNLQRGCMITNEAAVEHELVKQLHARFEGIDDAAIVTAMGSTSDASFLIWKRPPR